MGYTSSPTQTSISPVAQDSTAKVENEKAWADNMGDLILDSARFGAILGAAPANPAFGPASASPDGLSTDQSKLGYSFDF